MTIKERLLNVPVKDYTDAEVIEAVDYLRWHWMTTHPRYNELVEELKKRGREYTVFRWMENDQYPDDGRWIKLGESKSGEIERSDGAKDVAEKMTKLRLVRTSSDEDDYSEVWVHDDKGCSFYFGILKKRQ